MNKEFISRYGKFPILHPVTIMFFVGGLLITIIPFFHKEFIFIPLVNLFWAWRLISPYFDKYYFDNGKFVTRRFKSHEIIDIPPNAIFVLSYTIVEHSIAKKSSYTVNIIDENVETILKKLHEDDRACEWVAYRHGIKKVFIYDSAYIENIFKNNKLYFNTT